MPIGEEESIPLLFQLQEPLKRFNQVVGRSKFAHHLIDSSLVTTMLVHG